MQPHEPRAMFMKDAERVSYLSVTWAMFSFQKKGFDRAMDHRLISAVKPTDSNPSYFSDGISIP
jgi:hypothetical protein